MPGPRDDTQYPKRITLPTLNRKMGQYDAGKSTNPFMNTKNAGVEATPNASKVTWNPLTQRGPFSGGGSSLPFAQNSNPVTYNPSLFPQGGAGAGWTNPTSGPGGAAFNRIFSAQNPLLQNMGGVIGAGIKMGQGGGLPFASGGTGAPGLSAVEMYARDRINKALGPGWYENFVKTRGMSPVDFYRDPRNKYWDEPDSPDGAISSAIRDELNNARNAAQWAQEHGNTPIPQEIWDRWYYANRRGMGVGDVMNDGSEVVY